MAKDIASRLLELKEEIEQAKLDGASTEGVLKQNMQKLKDEFNCKTLEQAKLKLAQLDKQKEKIEEQIEEAFAELERNYSW